MRVIIRGDRGFCRWRLLQGCDRHQVGSLIGLAKNARLSARAQPLLADAERLYHASDRQQRLFSERTSGAATWNRPRRVLVKAEHGPKGSNPRYVATNLPGKPHLLHREQYCARGDMENLIKEQQQDLVADRTRCHRWWPNQVRLLLASVGYVLLEAIRRLGLTGTPLAQAQIGTVRLKLLKIGAVMRRNTRRVRFLLSSTYPYQALFRQVVVRLASG